MEETETISAVALLRAAKQMLQDAYIHIDLNDLDDAKADVRIAYRYIEYVLEAAAENNSEE